MSKRSFQSLLANDSNVVAVPQQQQPLKKRISLALISVSTVHEGSDEDINENDNGALKPQSSMGLDLMANANTTIQQPPPSTSNSDALGRNPSPIPPSLSSTEDSSCNDDDESRDDGGDNTLSHTKTKRQLSSSSSSLGSLKKENKGSAVPPLPPSPEEEEEGVAVNEIVVSSSTRTHDDNTNDNNRQGDFRTGLVFETGSGHYDRHNRFHKERPLRITIIMDALKKSPDNVWGRCHILGEEQQEAQQQQEQPQQSTSSSTTATGAPVVRIPTKAATEFLNDEDYLRVHLPGYMKRLDRLFDCNCCNDNNKQERLDREAEQYKSIYFTKDSLTEAKKAASSLCSLVEHVVQGNLDNGFAIIRPPGHHAEPGLAGGYCIINNIAVAAAYAREKLQRLPNGGGGVGVKRILIVDFDVHHGNGTQSIFIQDPNVLYFSAHRWHGGNYFPFLSNAGPTNVGWGDGMGRNINVGWTTKGVGDAEYLALWEVLLLPIAKEFQPDLILVSAGFDAAQGDLGECNLTPEGYGRLTRSLMTLNVPVVCALEGGYVRSILGKCVDSVVRALLDRGSAASQWKLQDEEDLKQRGEQQEVDVLNTINPTAAKNIKATISAHKPYWKCLA